MFIEAREIERDKELAVDVCIIGGGAAGITIALELEKEGRSIAVLEGGGLESESASQELSRGDITGVPYFPLVAASQRRLGGNTNMWGSWCRPFDDIDFEKRDWVPHSGWPINRRDLDPFYVRAHKVLKLKDFNYDESYLLEGKSELRVLPLKGEVKTKLWQFHKPPVRFGHDQKSELTNSKSITVYLHSNVTQIEADESGENISKVHVASIEGHRYFVRAKVFVLASGGIQNPRILLASNGVQKQGLGNQNDLVGRFFMEHPHIHRRGLVMASDAQLYPALYNTDSQYNHGIVGGICPTEELQRKERILNGSITLNPTIRYSAHAEMSEGLVDTMSGYLADLADLPGKLYEKAKLKITGKRTARAPRLVLDVSTRQEQTPNPESRVLLSTEKDALGVPRANLQWKLVGLDARTTTTLHKNVAKAFGASNVGRFKLELEENHPDDLANWDPKGSYEGIEGGWHHMGTTRMHEDPKQGVVDANCKIHGINNLYVAGSSVFPTSSFANPTLTLVALAVRLSDHLQKTVLV